MPLSYKSSSSSRRLPLDEPTLTTASLFIISIFITRMAPAGVIFCAFCLITQVMSQSTVSPNNSTVQAGNQTVSANDTMATDTYGGSTNATAPTGTGVMTEPLALYVLVPVALASILLHLCC
ncbi:hypothetical protein F2P79_021138 [Pimephales promelas]|nr:hypothetical protein F2P79_021138 [Pimephales promelas]